MFEALAEGLGLILQWQVLAYFALGCLVGLLLGAIPGMGGAIGLVLLLPAYAIGGMGAGDVKLLAGVGAWVGASVYLRSSLSSSFIRASGLDDAAGAGAGAR